MALDFNGTTQYVHVASTPVTDDGFTFAAWFYARAFISNSYVLCVENPGTPASAWILGITSTGPACRLTRRDATTAYQLESSTVIAINTWYHICGVCAANNDRRIFTNGGGKATGTTNVTDAGVPTAVTIGARQSNSVTGWHDGLIADVAIWAGVLSDDEVLAASKSITHSMIRPDILVAHWDLFGRRSAETDFIGGRNLTHVNSPTQAGHPRLSYPIRPNLVVPTARAPTMFMGGNVGKSLFDGLLR